MPPQTPVPRTPVRSQSPVRGRSHAVPDGDDFARVVASQLGLLSQHLMQEHTRRMNEREQELQAVVASLRAENKSLRHRLVEALPDSSDVLISEGSSPCREHQSEDVDIRASLQKALSQLDPVVSHDMFEGTAVALGSPVHSQERVAIQVGSPVRRISSVHGSCNREFEAPRTMATAIGSPVRNLSEVSPGPSSRKSSPLKRQIAPVSPAPSSKWSSPLRRNFSVASVSFASECFQLWHEWLARPDEAHPTLDLYPPDDQDEIDREASMVLELQRNGTLEEIHHSGRCAKFVWSPGSRSRLAWESFGVPVLAYDMVLIPMQVFELPHNLFMEVMSWTTLLYWSCDVVATFFVGFYTDKGKLIMSHWSIMKRYLWGSFWIDLFVISIDWLLVVVDSIASSAFETMGIARIGKLLRILRIFRVLRLLRLRKLRRFIHVLQDRIDSEYLSVVINIFKNLAFIVAASHFVACLWYWVGTFDIPGYSSWTLRYGLRDGTLWEYRYLTSLHWAVCQFTPGSMHVQPQNIPERAFSVGMLLCAMLVFSMFVSSLTNSMMTLHTLGSKNTRQLWLLRKLFRQNNVSRDLSMRIMRYVNVVLLPQQERVQHKDVGILALLSTPLRVELQTELHMPALTIHPFFEWFSRKSLPVMRRLCCVAIKRTSLSRGDVLFCAGQKASEMVFLVAGQLIYTPKRENSAQVPVNNGQWCCEAVLWCPWVHHGMLRAKVESDLMTLCALKFREVVTEHCIDMSYAQAYGEAFVQALNEAAKFADSAGVGYVSDISTDLLKSEAVLSVLHT